MDLYEYQARDVFEAHGVPVLRGITATTPEEARAAAAELGTPVVVVKAQVKTGGRGKAGGVKIAKSPDEAAQRAEEILGLDIKGHVVKTVMIAEGADIAEEYYFSLLLDRANRTLPGDVLPRGRHGHRDARRRAAGRAGPDPGRSQRRDRPGQGRRDRRRRGLRGRRRRPRSPGCCKLLGKVYEGEDATLVEVNPLVKTGDGKIVALDGKVSLDENADFRQPEHEALADKSAEDPLEAAAKAKGLNYVKLDGVGRHHRQRRRPGDEHPGRRRVRRRGVRRVAEAGELPRHRRRRQRRGDGQRAGDHHRRRAGEERLRERLRRHHRLRRGGQRHRAGVRAAGQPR